MRFVILAACVTSVLHAQEPSPFAPGAIPDSASALSPVFSRDCRSVWYTIGTGGNTSTIVTSHEADGKWTDPVTAEFSGQWRDLEAAMSPNGSYLVFASNRPASDGGTALDGNWGGKARPGSGGNLWRVDRHGSTWGKPVRLPDAINAGTTVFSPAVVADGSVYFMKPSPETGKFQIYRSQMTKGQYGPAERLPWSDEQWSNVDPAVAPDESFAIFSSSRPPTADKDLDLFIVYRHNGVWGEPQSLGPRVNSPSGEIEARLSPDTRTLFFASRRGGDHTRMWRVDRDPSVHSTCASE
jgi:Tol biopolymer transport system component